MVTVRLPIVRVKGGGGVLSAVTCNRPAQDRSRSITGHPQHLLRRSHIHVLMHTHALITPREPHKIKTAPKLLF